MDNRKVLEVEISSERADGDHNYSSICLPATPWELRDVLDRARAANNGAIYSLSCETLHPDIDYLPYEFPEAASLHELNHLAKQIAAMGEVEHGVLTAFEALIKTDERNNVPLTVPRLINLAASVPNVLVAPVGDDKELGEFVIENEMDERLAAVSDTTLPLLDIEKIGREYRESEGGIFLHGMYAVHNGEIKDAPCPAPAEKCGYTIELAVTKGCLNDPEYDNQFSEFPMLPNDNGALHRAAAQVGAASLKECTLRCADCIVPALTERITDALEYDVDYYPMVNELAGQLAWLEQKGLLTTYKAMLAAAPEDITLEEAHDLSCEVEGFILSKELASSSDYAREQLKNCGVPLLDELCGMANLYQYGKRLMAENHVMDTPYGLLRSVDGQTMEECLNRKPPQQMGMEMK